MIKFPQRFNLSQLDTLIPICIFLFHFFNCYYLSCSYIGSLVHGTECSIPQSFYCLVFLHLRLLNKWKKIIYNISLATYAFYLNLFIINYLKYICQ